MSLQPSLTGITLHPALAFGLTGIAVLGFLCRLSWRLEITMSLLHVAVLAGPRM